MYPPSQSCQTLQERRDFQKVQNHGQKHHCQHYILIQHPNILGVRRFGITASKKIGGAVKRNRIKRIVKEVFRLYLNHFPDSTDFVLVARKGSHELKMQEAAREILGCLILGNSMKKTSSAKV